MVLGGDSLSNAEALRELKRTSDLGRSFTADSNAVAALTYAAMLAHALVRSVRIHAALANEIPLEEPHPLDRSPAYTWCVPTLENS